MKNSIRGKVAVSAGALSVLGVAFFAALTAWWLYHEQLDDLSDKASPEQRADAQEEVMKLAASYLAALPIMAVVTAIGAWWLAGRVTAPLVALAKAAEQVDAHTLHERLPELGQNDEISRLTNVLNRLFERLEAQFTQASRFAADASHELRTPLAIMRGTIEEEIQSAPHSPHTPRLVELLEQNQRLASIADKLLLLARVDAGQFLSEVENVNFSELIEEIAEDIQILASERDLHLETKLAADVMMVGDRFLLRQLVLNLFDNAVHHNVSGGWIRATLERRGKKVILTIANSGEMIPKMVRQRLFERFFRAHSSRDRQSGGAGLGLSLCREIALAHGGDLRFVEAEKDANTFVLTIP